MFETIDASFSMYFQCNFSQHICKYIFLPIDLHILLSKFKSYRGGRAEGYVTGKQAHVEIKYLQKPLIKKHCNANIFILDLDDFVLKKCTSKIILQ